MDYLLYPTTSFNLITPQDFGGFTHPSLQHEMKHKLPTTFLSLLLELQTFCGKWGEENCLCKPVSPAIQSLKTSITIQHFRPSTSCFRDYRISELKKTGTIHCILFCIWLIRSRAQFIWPSQFWKILHSEETRKLLFHNGKNAKSCKMLL